MRLFVGGLPYSATDESLQDYFTTNSIRVTEASVKMDRDTGKSRGFGFVTVETELSLGEVVEQFNGTKMDGRAITVNEAQPKPQHDRTGGGGRHDRGRAYNNARR